MKTDMANEIDTGYVWKCPICNKEYHLIHRVSHIKRKIIHKFEEVVK